ASVGPYSFITDISRSNSLKVFLSKISPPDTIRFKPRSDRDESVLKNEGTVCKCVILFSNKKASNTDVLSIFSVVMTYSFAPFTNGKYNCSTEASKEILENNKKLSSDSIL